METLQRGAAQRNAQLPVTTSRLTQVSWTEAAAGLKRTTPPSVPSSPPGNKSPTLPATLSVSTQLEGANGSSLLDWLTSAGVIKFIRHHWGEKKSLKAQVRGCQRLISSLHRPVTIRTFKEVMVDPSHLHRGERSCHLLGFLLPPPPPPHSLHGEQWK